MKNSSSTQRDPVGDYYAACVRVDLSGAVRRLRAAAARTEASVRTKALFKRVKSRFGARDEDHRISSDDPFVWQLVRSYRSYYRQSLRAGKRVPAAERELAARLERLALSVGVARRELRTNERVESALGRELVRRGYHGLFGEVLPFRSLMIWKSERKRTYSVPLVEGRERVIVTLLEQFVEHDWLHYATFGRHGVGGWAKPDGLFCVATTYDLKSEAYRVSYLHHEGQHFADYRNFPRLKQAGLEYRAKLAELAALSRPDRLLARLAEQASNDPKLPHPFANHRLITDFRELEIAFRDRAAIRAAARALLRADTARLRKRKTPRS